VISKKIMIKVRLYTYISTKKMTWVYIQERKKDDLLDHIFLNTYHIIMSLDLSKRTKNSANFGKII
jgi:hypothetical protein